MASFNRTHVEIYAQHSNVTGSCFLMIIKLSNGKIIKGVIDCGVFQEEEFAKENYNFIFNPEEIEFVLITHNHVDHIGRVPLLLRRGYKGKIHSSRDTKILSAYAMSDSQKILKNRAKRNNEPIIYEEQDVSNAIRAFEGHPILKNNDKWEDKRFWVHDNVRVTLLSNGHLVGACMILIEVIDPGGESINLLFTGDYNNQNTFFDVGDIPEEIRNLPLTIITEATYGDVIRENDAKAKKNVYNFESNVMQAMENGDSILIPSFSLGRTQEVLYKLRSMQDSGKLNGGVTIFLDGTLAKTYTDLFVRGVLDIKPGMRDFLPYSFVPIGKNSREDVLNNRKQKIILTTSGNGSHGPAQMWIPIFLRNPRGLIHFTGYCTVGTLGRRLKDCQIDDFVLCGGALEQKKSKVEFTAEFSAHGDQNVLVELIKKFKYPQSIIINHGSPLSQIALGKRLYSKYNAKKIVFINRQNGYRIYQDGVAKTLSTSI